MPVIAMLLLHIMDKMKAVVKSATGKCVVNSNSKPKGYSDGQVCVSVCVCVCLLLVCQRVWLSLVVAIILSVIP